MNPLECLDVLSQRHRYLEARVQAKKSVGWEYVYDQRERDALGWAVLVLQQAFVPAPEVAADVDCPHPDDKRVNTTTMGGGEPEFYCTLCREKVKGRA